MQKGDELVYFLRELLLANWQGTVGFNKYVFMKFWFMKLYMMEIW